MRIVLDASVALKTALIEADSAQAEALVADYIAGIHDLLAPDIFLAGIFHRASYGSAVIQYGGAGLKGFDAKTRRREEGKKNAPSPDKVKLQYECLLLLLLCATPRPGVSASKRL